MNDLSNLFSYRVWTCLSCHCPFECLSFPNTHPATYTAFKFNSAKKANASFINKKRRHWQHYKTLINGLENREQCCCCKRNKKTHMENSMRMDEQRSNKSMSSGWLSFSHHLENGMIAQYHFGFYSSFCCVCDFRAIPLWRYQFF